MSIIEVENLVKKFNGLTAVDGISLEVKEGEIFGFLGPNGAGKTTTINIICTLLQPTSGRIVLDGYDVTAHPDAVRRSIGLVFQDTTLDDRLTAKENLDFHGVLYNVPALIRRQRVEELLKMVELYDRRDSIVRTFSGGMKRRLEIARGILHHPKVLFLDEPTLGLDPQTRSHIWSYILDLRQRAGVTIFLTTHYMDEAGNADRIAIIDYGRIVALDTPERLRSLVGGDVITLKTIDDARAAHELSRIFNIQAQQGTDGLRFEVSNGEQFIPGLVSSLQTGVTSVSLRRPTLDDVFLKLTGRQIRDEEVDGMDRARLIWRARGGRRFH
ncbi:MAG: ATP-binding cassette domain-containing protein [Chloroflexi bacterium]|nr:ATP-binding cassette domain-containing protein [Chloroflexota bacterium]MCL5074694.1 ATP-binding cassette domain-containing protein [Chloroflexota bacterium]